MNTYGAETHADSPTWTAMRRAQIDKQNQLARAVRIIAESSCAPVAQILIPANPFGQEN